MVDENELSKRFGYKNNSNLVIQTGQRNRENAPTGEAESLVGRIKYRMGDLANKGVKVKKQEKKVINRKTSNKIVNENETYNILEMDIGSKNRYRPTTIETKLAYDELLGILTDILGSQPGNIMDDIVFELLSILKNGEINEEEKRERCNNILSDIKNDDYTEIIDKSRKITDFIYNIDDELEESDVRNSSEVAVVFDESESEDSSNDDYKNELDDGLDVIDTESENENYLYEENDGDNDNNYDENNESEDFIHSIHSKSDKNNLIEDPDIIEINKLDAYWLQRELYSLYNDAEKSLELEQKIISILEIVDDQECENSLVLLFNYENFSWIKKLLKNRWNIYFCTILGQASSDNEKGKIIEKMKSHPQGSIVLDLLSKPSILKGKSSSFLNSIEKLIENSVDETNNNTAKDTSTIMEGSGYLYSKRTRGKLLDLERIYQEQSINTNLNTKVVLPEGTERVEDVDYDSIVIYPITAKRERINKVSISDLPEWCRECFSCVSITHLNEIQSKVYDTAFKEYNENMLICAPTGSGKTNIAMLCILNVISQYITKQGGEKPILDISKFKIVYVSPIKALVAEQVESLRMRLKPLGITVNEMTGDTRVSRSLMDLTQVFVTTPEKFDVITRKTTDGLSDRVKLIIFDEVHMLHDSRGAVLEGIVARFKKSYVRMVGLSATLPNYLDIAEFLSVDPVKGLFHFGPEYRPVPLLQTFIGIKAKKGFKKLQLMNELVLERVLNDITKHQILVFVHSRKDTLQTARFIRDKSIEKGRSELFFQGSSNVSREIIFDEISKIKSNNLKEILPSGIGIHHAGLVRSDRKIIEDLFSDGHIKVLVTTATLAWGVNLPAHTVIIKGTQIYQPERGEWTELSPLDMLQMIGRGGRPQYDNNGHGIVITDFDHLTYYLSLLNQQLNIESQLIPKLPDFINAEISLGNIKNKSDIINWIKDTFLYIRVRRNPKLYGLDIDRGGNLDLEKELQDHDMNQESRDILIKKSIENYLLKLIETSIDRLEKCEMIQYDGRDGVIESLFLGKISSHFYLTPETVCDLNKQLLPNLSEIQLFRLFSTCKEFKYLVVRNEEKIELEKLVNKVPIPIQGIRTAVNNMNGMENINSNMMIDLDVYTKINVLLQLYLTGSRWVNAKLTLLSDLHYIVQSAPRIFRAVFHLSLYKRWSTLAKRTLKIATMVERRTWEAMSPLRQFKGISEEVVKRLEKKDINWNKYYDFTSNQLGEILKSGKLGPVLYNLIRKLPRVNIKGTVFPLDSRVLQVNLVVKPDFIWDTRIHGQSLSGDINTEKMNTGETFWIFIEDCNGDYLYYSDMIVIRPSFRGRNDEENNTEIKMEDEYHLSYQIFLDKNNIDSYYDGNNDDVIPPFILVKAIADRWLHSETCIPISLERLILPNKHKEYTELLDLNPINITKGFSDNKLIDKYLERMFNVKNIDEDIKLNPIQTQLFNLIYNSDKSFYLSSPPGNGQFICLCMGILRELKIRPDLLDDNFQVLILECNSEKVNYIGSKLINIFGDSAVGILNNNSDFNDMIISKKSIIVSNVYYWDKVSKKLSKIREILKSLKLLVINELEYIFNNNNNGNDNFSGYVVESAISRLRYMITPLNLNIRTFGYSKCISNAYEVSEWLGIPKENTFSFDQNIFNDSIEKRVIGFDSYYRSTRLQMMLKYIKEQILRLKVNEGKKDTLLIYVLEYEFCLSISNELSLFISENISIHSNLCNNDILLNKNNISILERYVTNGIGYLYRSQPELEKEYVITQYNSGNICILIACEDMKDFINLKFNRVIVMDTKKIDQDDNMGSSTINFSDRRNVEYSHLDIHQMMSRCHHCTNNKSYYNSRSSFTLLCSTNKQEFYEYILENTLPLESSIDDGIIDCINTEIALRTIKTKQDTIDWITWTLYYRRISKVS